MDNQHLTITSSKPLSQPGEVRSAKPAATYLDANPKITDIDLTKLVPELDAIATDIISHQKDALVSRKDLAQKTKDFRKLDDPAKLNEIKSLLKGAPR